MNKKSIGPKIDFAKNPAIASAEEILKSKEVCDFLKAELSAKHVTAILPKDFVEYVLERMSSGNESTGFGGRLKGIGRESFPPGLGRLLRNTKGRLRSRFFRPKMDFTRLAFRLFVISGMYEMLLRDCKR